MFETNIVMGNSLIENSLIWEQKNKKQLDLFLEFLSCSVNTSMFWLT